MAMQSNGMEISFEQFNSAIDDAVAVHQGEIDEIVDEIWSEIDPDGTLRK